jgi:putative oxidoreductase
MNKLFSNTPIAISQGIAFVRIVVGLLLVYHGHEVFRPDLMKGYMDWENFSNSFGAFLVYAGKAAELVAGILLVIGQLTRVASLIIVGTFAYILFFIGHGKFWYEDQHPFMFLLFGVLFFFTGSGSLREKG